MDEKQYAQAKKIARQKVAFIRHFITYIIVLAVLAAINNLTSRGYQWWLWIALFWGIGIFINFLNAYLFRGGGLKSIEKQLIQKEMERMKNEK
jgi:uncharacterized membrane protein YdbT with pleckstrin-like domain